MGAFCVFGISRSACKAEATRRTPTYVTEDGERRELTMAEWAAARDQMAANLFEHGEKVARISPELDAPQFCQDWLAAGPDEVRAAVVMVRGGKVDKKGLPIVRNGAQLLTWKPYDQNTTQAQGASK